MAKNSILANKFPDQEVDTFKEPLKGMEYKTSEWPAHLGMVFMVEDIESDFKDKRSGVYVKRKILSY